MEVLESQILTLRTRGKLHGKRQNKGSFLKQVPPQPGQQLPRVISEGATATPAYGANYDMETTLKGHEWRSGVPPGGQALSFELATITTSV